MFLTFVWVLFLKADLECLCASVTQSFSCLAYSFASISFYQSMRSVFSSDLHLFFLFLRR